MIYGQVKKKKKKGYCQRQQFEKKEIRQHGLEASRCNATQQTQAYGTNTWSSQGISGSQRHGPIPTVPGQLRPQEEQPLAGCLRPHLRQGPLLPRRPLGLPAIGGLALLFVSRLFLLIN